MTREQQQAREDKFVKLVKSLLPEGWSAGVGCFMDMGSMNMTKNHIWVSLNERMPMEFRHVSEGKTEEEKLWIKSEQKAWIKTREEHANQIAEVLRRELPSKARVAQQYGSVYVMGLI